MWSSRYADPVLPELPFKLPSSSRALDVTLPLGAEGAFIAHADGRHAAARD